jgi:hypothetical protein
MPLLQTVNLNSIPLAAQSSLVVRYLNGLQKNLFYSLL